MNPHPKLRKTIKWGGAAVTVLLVVVWIGSGWWGIARRGSKYYVATGAGIVLFSFDFTRHAAPGWWFASEPGGSFVKGWRWFRAERVGTTAVVEIPYWFPVLLAVGATAVAWHLDTLARRRTRLNLCPKCNYDRAGLAKGAVCPECGGKGEPA